MYTQLVKSLTVSMKKINYVNKAISTRSVTKYVIKRSTVDSRHVNDDYDISLSFIIASHVKLPSTRYINQYFVDKKEHMNKQL